MLCVISFIFVFVIVAQLEGGDITFGQAIFYGFYGLLMFYHTSKKYWNYEEPKRMKKGDRK